MINPHQIQKAKMQNVPAFLNKLYNMVEDPASDELIRWAADGSSFIVARHEDLAKKVLPRFFKHSNFSSFVRQLNMYGFHKVPHLQQGVLQTDGKAEQWEFSNPHFQRNQPDLLLLVTRKKGRDADEKEHGHYDLSHVLDEISTIKKHQMSISSHLKTIQSDNQVLWRENIVARERHQRHQETIDKILRFLASVFSNEKERPTIPRKRRYLIANTSTDDSKRDGQEPSPAKVRCSSPKQKSTGYTLEERGETEQTRSSASSQARSSASPKTRSDGLSTLTRPSESLVADLAEAIALNDQTKQQLSTQGRLF
ncbi:HSF-type DNA-binding-domain-containing protein [Spinellus fusiger]|nr:HSF-type DNA-binding-domain-containing protein [Spinellus fusiger]